MGTTKKDLVEDLWKKPYSLKRKYIEDRAKAGVYHDYETDLAAPKMTLAQDLTAAGFSDLAEKVRDGAYDDESPSVEQEEALRAEVGGDFYDAVMGKAPRGSS